MVAKIFNKLSSSKSCPAVLMWTKERFDKKSHNSKHVKLIINVDVLSAVMKKEIKVSRNEFK